MSLPALLDRVLSAPLAGVGSRRAIGYLGWDVPVELILAAGAAPVQLASLAAPDDTVLADRYLENSFSAQSRTIAQWWLSGRLDSLSAVIFSRSDDSAQRLYYYLCELQRFGECKGPQPLLYDLARIGRGTSVEYTVESTHSLATALGADAGLIDTAIQRVSARFDLLGALAKLRGAAAVPSGRLAHRIIRAARADWSEAFDASLREWLAAAATMKPRKRVLLVGSVPADDELHAAIENDDVVVVGEINEAFVSAESTATEMSSHARHAGRGISSRARPAASGVDVGSPSHVSGLSASRGIEAVARRCYQQTAVARELLQSPAEIVKVAKALRADAVIVWMVATDTGLAWEAPRIERALRDAGLPTLMLTSQPQALSAAALTQIAQFRNALEVA
ncbi:2-hydroxyacyl-CoA dehydratase [Steroidobacter sp. S1-65]|uniref:2-hydroxyacyl-CoA dehydratase n=1 Tax=Steroidobacter gossypii TaxID=2805490 RepID=A0ABS1WZA1_9GAMM|nr:2-hydroxyacyl-CoA dehydratase family protein [Steroidobacter gossypii]MBM0106309.1 2-hydroxyacyl-CoA dehydratase [Steroidobacter gossypii]